MSQDRSSFSRADLLDIEAIGQPGNRRFRIYARGPQGSASLWLEKEQLAVLAQALDQVLARASGALVLRPEVQVPTPPLPHAPRDFPRRPDLEFEVGQLQLGMDEEHDVLLLRAAPLRLLEREGELELDTDVEPLFSAYISRVQAERFATHVSAVLAAGRPRCPLCGEPMAARHLCEKQNGFHPVGLN